MRNKTQTDLFSSIENYLVIGSQLLFLIQILIYNPETFLFLKIANIKKMFTLLRLRKRNDVSLILIKVEITSEIKI